LEEVEKLREQVRYLSAREAVRDELLLNLKPARSKAALAEMGMDGVEVDDKGRVLGAKGEAQRIKGMVPELFTDHAPKRNRFYGRSRKMSETRRKAAAIRAQIEEARNAYKRDVAGLWKTLSNGEKVAKYDETRAKEIEQHARYIRTKTIQALEEEATALMAQVEQEEARALDYSPSTILGAGDRQAANELLPLIQAEIEAMDTSEVAARVERLASADDETLPTRYAYWAATRQRRRSLLDRQASRGGGYAGATAQLTALDEPLQLLSNTLFAQENERRTTDIKADRQAVEGVLERAYVSRHGVDDMAQAHAVQNQWVHQQDRLPTAPLVSSTGEIADDGTSANPGQE